MDFSLSADRIAFGASVRGFAEKRLAAGAVARAHTAGFPAEGARPMAGQGGRLMEAVRAMERIALACPRGLSRRPLRAPK